MTYVLPAPLAGIAALTRGSCFPSDAPLGETAVLALLRERGFIDLKVASVSATLTALKFVRARK